ncbi:MAG: chlorophyll synthesis pathway protein BchC [Pseudomonadota bacterium]
MDTRAVVLEKPEAIKVQSLALTAPSRDDLVVDVTWSGISSGTERLLWSGRMPPFPGMGYPLVPGYESVGQVAEAGPEAAHKVGDWVFVPGASCYGAVRGLFGGTAARLVVPDRRVTTLPDGLGEEGILLALAATAQHAIAHLQASEAQGPSLIVGHGVLGRLLARLLVASGAPAPRVWETLAARRYGAAGYEVTTADADDKRDYAAIIDASGDAEILDSLVMRLARGGEIIMAGFYSERPSFAFPPAFMKEARLRIAAEFTPADVQAVARLLESGRLSLDGLITHRQPAEEAEEAYRTAFGDSDCLKMVLDWRSN